MRLSDIRDLPVIDSRAARRVGTVASVSIDPTLNQVALFWVTLTSTGEAAAIPRSLVRRVGSHAVMLKEGLRTMPATDAAGAGHIDLETLVGLEVVGENGDRLGSLSDAQVDPDTLRIECYEMAVAALERWFGGGGRIQAETVLACSSELMVVRTLGAPLAEDATQPGLQPVPGEGTAPTS